MLHRRLGKPDDGGQVANAELMGSKRGHDSQPSRIAERGKKCGEPVQVMSIWKCPLRSPNRVEMDDELLANRGGRFGELR